MVWQASALECCMNTGPHTRNALKVITENLDWEGGLFAISSFGFGGTNVHAVLEGAIRSRPSAVKDGQHVKEDSICPPAQSNPNISELGLPLLARTAAGLNRLSELVSKVSLVTLPSQETLWSVPHLKEMQICQCKSNLAPV